MKKAHLVFRPAAVHQKACVESFAAGLKKHGWQTTISHEFVRSDLLCLWGIRRKEMIQRQKALGGEVCIMERGYTAWPQWISVSFGGNLNNRAKFRGPLTDPSRYEKHVSHLMKPWQPREDGEVIVMGQCYGDTSVGHIDVRSKFPEIVMKLRDAGFPTRFRPHPRERITCPIEEDFAKARFIVTLNSTSGVEAALAGIPVVALDQGSMVWDISGHELKPPPMPDRASWAHALAWKQWMLEEMASGDCWAAVGGETEARAA